MFRALGCAYLEQTCLENCNSRLLSTWRDVWSVGAFQTWREIGLVRLTLGIVKSEVAGVPLRKGPAWRSTRSERGFGYFGDLGVDGFCGFELFWVFFLEVEGFFLFFPPFHLSKNSRPVWFQKNVLFQGMLMLPTWKMWEIVWLGS